MMQKGSWLVCYFICAGVYDDALIPVPSLVHDHTRAAVKEVKERLAATWKL